MSGALRGWVLSAPELGSECNITEGRPWPWGLAAWEAENPEFQWPLGYREEGPNPKRGATRGLKFWEFRWRFEIIAWHHFGVDHIV